MNASSPQPSLTINLKFKYLAAGAVFAISTFLSGLPSNASALPEALRTQVSCAGERCDRTESSLRPLLGPMVAQVGPDLSTGQMLGRWRLVRTPGPDNKGDVVSIMRTAEALESDPDFAGLMIRCRERSALQIAFVIVRPFALRSHPKIFVTAGSTNVNFEASVIPPGSLLSLPNEAEVLARGPWQSAKELRVKIESGPDKIDGLVSLENLAGAISSLQASCPAQ
jgi:hypothetical protein